MSVKEVTSKGPSWVANGVSKVLSAGEISARFLLGDRYDKITSYLWGSKAKGPTFAAESKALFQRVESLQPVEKKQPLAPYALATGELPGDLSAVGRIVAFDIMAIDSHPVNPIMGVTTGLNLIWGTLNAQAAYENIHHAHDIGNYKEENLQKVALAKSVTQLTAGTVFLGIRSLTLASMIEEFTIHTAAPTLVGRVTAYLCHIGSFLFGIYFSIIALGSGKRLWDLHAFSNKSDKADTREKLIEFLEKRVGLNQTDLDASLKKKGISDETLYEEGLNDLTQKFTTLFNQLLNNVKGEKIPDHVKLYKDLISPEMRDLVIAHGKELRKALLATKKEEKMERLTSTKLVNLIKDASKNNLLGRLQSNDPAAIKEFRAIEIELESSLKGHKMTNATVFTCAVLGIIATILLLPWVGEFVLVGSVIFLIATLGFLAVDAIGYMSTLESGQQPGKYDKLLHRSLIVSAVIGFIATVGLTLWLSAPLAPILLGLVFMIAVIAVSAIALEKIHEIEERNRLEKLFKPETPKPTIDWKVIRDQTDALVKKLHDEYEARVARKAS